MPVHLSQTPAVPDVQQDRLGRMARGRLQLVPETGIFRGNRVKVMSIWHLHRLLLHLQYQALLPHLIKFLTILHYSVSIKMADTDSNKPNKQNITESSNDILEGRVWIIKKDNIDTDMIFHNRYLSITDIERYGTIYL